MALSPEDIALSREELLEVEKLESHLDEGLKKASFPETGPIILVLGDYPLRIINEVMIRYRKAGWSKVEQANGHMAFNK